MNLSKWFCAGYAAAKNDFLFEKVYSFSNFIFFSLFPSCLFSEYRN